MSTRKNTYSKAVAERICERISNGEPLRQICRDPNMPAWRTVYDWMNRYEDFAARIARARELGFDAIAEEALAIADTPVTGEEIEEDGDKTKIKRGDMLGHRKLQVETRLKLLAKWSPEKYGDKQQVDLKGNLDLRNMTVDEIKAELAALAAAGVLGGVNE